MSSFEPGATFETVVVGVCANDVVRVWHDDGRTTLLTSDSDLSHVFGFGMTARSEVAHRVFREVALLDLHDDGASATLIVPDRFTADDGSVRSRTFSVRRAEPRDASSKATWQHMAHHLAACLEHAVLRGESVLLSAGGWEPPSPRMYVRFQPLEHDGEHVGVLETYPVPSWDTVGWGEMESPADGEPVMATNAISEESIRGAAQLFAIAASRWGVSPWDLALTFAADSHSPQRSDSPQQADSSTHPASAEENRSATIIDRTIVGAVLAPPKDPRRRRLAHQVAAVMCSRTQRRGTRDMDLLRDTARPLLTSTKGYEDAITEWLAEVDGFPTWLSCVMRARIVLSNNLDDSHLPQMIRSQLPRLLPRTQEWVRNSIAQGEPSQLADATSSLVPELEHATDEGDLRHAGALAGIAVDLLATVTSAYSAGPAAEHHVAVLRSWGKYIDDALETVVEELARARATVDSPIPSTAPPEPSGTPPRSAHDHAPAGPAPAEHSGIRDESPVAGFAAQTYKILAAVVTLMSERFLIEVDTPLHRAVYIQGIVEDVGLHIEVPSNEFLEPPLTPAQLEQLLELGWQEPTDDLPNYWRLLEHREIVPGDVAAHLLRTLRVYGVTGDETFSIAPDDLGRAAISAAGGA